MIEAVRANAVGFSQSISSEEDNSKGKEDLDGSESLPASVADNATSEGEAAEPWLEGEGRETSMESSPPVDSVSSGSLLILMSVVIMKESEGGQYRREELKRQNRMGELKAEKEGRLTESRMLKGP